MDCLKRCHSLLVLIVVFNTVARVWEINTVDSSRLLHYAQLRVPRQYFWKLFWNISCHSKFLCIEHFIWSLFLIFVIWSWQRTASIATEFLLYGGRGRYNVLHGLILMDVQESTKYKDVHDGFECVLILKELSLVYQKVGQEKENSVPFWNHIALYLPKALDSPVCQILKPHLQRRSTCYEIPLTSGGSRKFYMRRQEMLAGWYGRQYVGALI